MHQGSCLCESIRYQIDSDLKSIVNCHCKFCRKAHGSAFTTLLFMPFARLTVVAGSELIARFHVESLNADRCFCMKCGARLYSHLPSMGMVSLVVATLEGEPDFAPRAHFNTASKCSWFEINDELPQFDSVPTPAEFRQLLSS